MRRLYIFIIAGLVFSNISAQSIQNSETSEQAQEILDMRGYPNPVSAKLHFNISDKMLGHSVRVINVLGSEVMSYELSTTHDAIDVSTIQAGIYLYRIVDKNDKIILTGKFNKE